MTVPCPPASLHAALAAMNDRDHREYLNGLRRIENAQRKASQNAVVKGARPRDYVRDDPGYPLGKGFPGGDTLRLDGESHRATWARILRSDPCAYCDQAKSGTLDHIEPRSLPARGLGGAHSWTNFVGACEGCNGRKSDRSLLSFLAARAGCWPHPK